MAPAAIRTSRMIVVAACPDCRLRQGAEHFRHLLGPGWRKASVTLGDDRSSIDSIFVVSEIFSHSTVSSISRVCWTHFLIRRGNRSGFRRSARGGNHGYVTAWYL